MKVQTDERYTQSYIVTAIIKTILGSRKHKHNTRVSYPCGYMYCTIYIYLDEPTQYENTVCSDYHEFCVEVLIICIYCYLSRIERV